MSPKWVRESKDTGNVLSGALCMYLIITIFNNPFATRLLPSCNWFAGRPPDFYPADLHYSPNYLNMVYKTFSAPAQAIRQLANYLASLEVVIDYLMAASVFGARGGQTETEKFPVMVLSEIAI